jgi:hypothetical protein
MEDKQTTCPEDTDSLSTNVQAGGASTQIVALAQRLSRSGGRMTGQEQFGE